MIYQEKTEPKCFSWPSLSLVETDLVLQNTGNVFFMVPSFCSFLSLLCLFVLVDLCFFVADFQGL